MFLRYERPFGQDCNISYISTKEGGTFMKKNVKKLSAVLSVIMLMILASPLTVLAAEEEAAASAKFYSADRCHCAGVDHKGGIQFAVYRNFSWRTVLLRI